MRKLTLISMLALGLGGCAHTNAAHGFEAAQAGLAIGDVAFNEAVKTYRTAVDALRLHCATMADPDACEVRLHVTNEDVEMTIEAAAAVRDAYDATVLTVDELQAAHGEVSPRMLRVVEAYRGLAD